MAVASRRPWLRRTLLGVGIVVVAVGLYSGWSVWSAYRTADAIRQLEFDPELTRAALAVAEPDRTNDAAPKLQSEPPAEPVTDDGFNSFLIVGTDERPGFGGSRADVILVVVLPGGDGSPVLFSLPRDLYVTNPCTGHQARINTLLGGCGITATGPELLAVGVEDFTGVPIEHFALVDFGGFEQVIDAIGGVEICLEHAIRDPKVNYEGTILSAGCNMADGAQALAWVRSRNTLEYVDGVGWRTQPGVNDLVRNERQQDLLFTILERAGGFRDITGLVTLAESLADAVEVDEGLSIIDAARLVWRLRDLSYEDVVRLTVPVQNFVTDSGAAVLRPIGSFSDLLDEALETAMLGTQPAS